jgi:hydroxymethylglutaryl-CoA synthase
MPVNAMAALYVWGLSMDESHMGELRQLAEAAGADYFTVLAEMRSRPNLFQAILDGSLDAEVYPESMKAVRHFRKTHKFNEVVSEKMSLGSDTMRDLGNLYTASLPAWIAAGLDEASRAGKDLAGHELVLIGYGSGDAAEAIPARVSRRWTKAAERIGIAESLSRGISIDQAQYEALHAGLTPPGLAYAPSAEFVIERIGDRKEADFQDAGVEYYRYVR